MTLEDMRELKNCSLIDETNLDGSTMNGTSTEADLANRFSARTTSVYTAKILFEEHTPYMREYSPDGTLTIFINDHFIREVRRQLSGAVGPGESLFSPYEQLFWDNYIEWVNGTVYDGELLQAIEALDYWLVEELQSHTHDTVERSYDTTHKWMKIIKREEV